MDTSLRFPWENGKRGSLIAIDPSHAGEFRRSSMRQASRRPSAALSVLGALLWLAGCSLQIIDARSVNRSLTYVGWPSDSASGNASSDLPSRSVAIRPGMRVVFHSSSLGPFPIGMDVVGKNGITPALIRYEWI